MAEKQEKDYNETLRQRKKAQKDFLELKRMQNGEISQKKADRKTETPLDRINNFFFYYKGAIIAVIIFAVILSALIVQCANRPNYDLEVIVYDYKLFADEQISAIETYFEENIHDFNGDGKIQVTVANCSYGVGTSTAEFEQTMLTKLQSLIVSDSKAMLFLTSDKGYEYINGIDNEMDGLLGEKLYLGNDFYEKCDILENYPLPENLSLSVRRINGTLMEHNDTAVNSNAVAYSVYKIISEKADNVGKD